MTEIKPALSAEEWEDVLSWPYGVSDAIIRPAEMLGYGHNTPEDRHHVAALALHGQPFGFTWEMVDEILRAANEAEWALGPGDEGRASAAAATLRQAADRIAALLPPRDSGTESEAGECLRDVKPLADVVRDILATVPGGAAAPLHVEGDPGVVVMPYRMEPPLDAIDALKRAADLAGMVGWEIALTTDGLTLRRAE